MPLKKAVSAARSDILTIEKKKNRTHERDGRDGQRPSSVAATQQCQLVHCAMCYPQDLTKGQQSKHQLSSHGEEVERMKEIEVYVSLCVRALFVCLFHIYLEQVIQQTCVLYFRMLCLHINVFGLVFYTRQLVFCSELNITRNVYDHAQIFARCRMSKQQNHVFALASSAFFLARAAKHL